MSCCMGVLGSCVSCWRIWMSGVKVRTNTQTNILYLHLAPPRLILTPHPTPPHPLVSVLGVLAGYARRFFKRPGKGRAEVIDDEKRRGRVSDMNFVPPTPTANPNTTSSQNPSPITLPPRERKKIKRRVVRKAFYSDESDESDEESVYVSSDDDHHQPQNPTNTTTGTKATTSNYETMDSDEHLCPDHRLLLRSSLPLLRSRNSGVVLAVCSLHYYCGVSSIPSRQAIGKGETQ